MVSSMPQDERTLRKANLESTHPEEDFNRLTSLVEESGRLLWSRARCTSMRKPAARSSALLMTWSCSQSQPEPIQARSESRLGDSDLGVNAERLAGLRSALQH